MSVLEIKRGAEREIIITIKPPKRFKPAREHFRKAGREFLLGLSSLIEALISEEEKKEEKKELKKIEVE